MKNFVFTILVCLIFSGLAQTQSLRKKQVLVKSIDEKVRLDTKKPTVYITFDHADEVEPYYDGEGKQRIWLRLHNNTKWKVWAYPFLDERKNEISLCHKVERENEEIQTEIPLGYIRFRDHKRCLLMAPVESGKSLLFSVPREHLAENLMVRIRFMYSWQDYELPAGSPDSPEFSTSVVFRSSDLPK